MRQPTIVLAAIFGLATAGIMPAAAQPQTTHTDKAGSAAPDGTTGSSNYTGKGESGAGGAKVDHGPSEGAGSPSGKSNTYTQ